MNKIRKDKELVQVCKEKGLFIGNVIKNVEKIKENLNTTEIYPIFESKINEDSVDQDNKFINAVKY